MYEMENTTPFATSFCVFFRQTVEQKCVVIEYYTYPGSQRGRIGVEPSYSCSHVMLQLVLGKKRLSAHCGEWKEKATLEQRVHLR